MTEEAAEVTEPKPNTTESDDTHEVGVGPWPGEWPADDHFDPEYLEHGDRRNVPDNRRYWRTEAIVAELDTRRTQLHIAIENTGHDFNIGSVVRTANAFNVAGVHIIGRRRWNRRGAMVTDKYLHIHYHPTINEFLDWCTQMGVSPIAVDNLPGATPLHATTLPCPAALILGEEGRGLSDEAWAACDTRVEIVQIGSTRSINLGAAAAIVMHHWMTQHSTDHGGRSAD